MILDIEEHEDTPLILGQPFINTGGALIDEEEVFKVFGTAKNSFLPLLCNFVQTINKIKVIVAKSNPSMGKKNHTKNKVILKDPR